MNYINSDELHQLWVNTKCNEIKQIQKLLLIGFQRSEDRFRLPTELPQGTPSKLPKGTPPQSTQEPSKAPKPARDKLGSSKGPQGTSEGRLWTP